MGSENQGDPGLMAEEGRAAKQLDLIALHACKLWTLGWDPETKAIELHLVGTQHSVPTEMLGDSWC